MPDVDHIPHSWDVPYSHPPPTRDTWLAVLALPQILLHVIRWAYVVRRLMTRITVVPLAATFAPVHTTRPRSPTYHHHPLNRVVPSSLKCDDQICRMFLSLGQIEVQSRRLLPRQAGAQSDTGRA
jgi:hypothetical protein